MMDLSKVRSYYIACGYTDLRLGIDGLAAVVTQQYGGQLNEESLFLFCGRRTDRIKALYWTGDGYILLYKRLSNGRFQWPRSEAELKLLDSALEQILTRTNDAFENDDIALARQVEPLEEVIDILVEKLRDGHIKRLKDGICSIDTGVVFLDVLNNVERISDHCSNVAARLVGTSEGDDYDSHTLKSLMHHNPSKEYSLMYEECCKEYLTPLAAMEKEA